MDSVDRKERAAGNGGLGIGGRLRTRGVDVLVLLADIELCCLQRTKGGYPWHPLYVRSTARPAKMVKPPNANLNENSLIENYPQ
jgi:hypothetical protein